MKNLKKIIVTVFTMTLLMSVTAFAATAAESLAAVKAKLVEAGLSAAYAEEVSTYLTANPITEAQANGIIANITEVKTLVGTKTEATDFTEGELNILKAKIQTTASSVGLVVSKSGSNVQILDASGTVVGTSTIAEAITAATNINVATLTEAVTLAKEYSATAGATGATTTQATAMKKTATNNGNVLVLGLGILALAGSVFVVSKKVQA